METGTRQYASDVWAVCSSSSQHRRPSPVCDSIPSRQRSLARHCSVRPSTLILFHEQFSSPAPLRRPLRNLGFGRTGGRLRTSVRVRDEVPKGEKAVLNLSLCAKSSRIFKRTTALTRSLTLVAIVTSSDNSLHPGSPLSRTCHESCVTGSRCRILPTLLMREDRSPYIVTPLECPWRWDCLESPEDVVFTDKADPFGPRACRTSIFHRCCLPVAVGMHDMNTVACHDPP